MPNARILVVDDNSHQHELFRCYSSVANDIELEHAMTLDEALDIIAERAPSIIFLDNRLEPFDDFRETVPRIRERGFDGRIVVLSADVDTNAFKEINRFTVHSYLDKLDITLNNFGAIVAERLR